MTRLINDEAEAAREFYGPSQDQADDTPAAGFCPTPRLDALESLQMARKYQTENKYLVAALEFTRNALERKDGEDALRIVNDVLARWGRA